MTTLTPNARRFARGRGFARQSGVSLLETMMALLVGGVLAACAVPSFSNVMQSRHLLPTTQQLYTAFQLAHSEALARGRRVAVAAREESWARGWDVFVDANDNGRHDDGEALIRAFEPVANTMTITAAFGATYNGRAISYDSLGKPVRPGSQGLAIGRLTLAQGAETRTLCFATVRVRMTKGTVCS
jgi:type IV fimbrial biogenesis protein FimT